MKRQLRVALLVSTALCAPRAWAEDTYALEDITVEGASYQTEGSDSYRSGLISVGEKAAMTPREVPQSTTVITRKQIEDGGYTALETALEDTAGILVLNNDTGRSSLFSRGFEFDYLYYDGLPAPVSSIYGTQPDLAIIDHVEILKGPSGLFIGTGSPAGSVNMRLKQANRTDPGGYVTTTVDDNGQTRIEGDVGGRLNASGTLRGRAVVAYARGDGFVDKQTNGVTDYYGTLAWDATPDTTVTLSLNHMERDIDPFNGLPTYADGSLIWIDPSATTAADWNHFENSVTDAIAAVEHRLAGGGRLKFSLRQSHQTADFKYAYASGTADADNVISQLAWISRKFTQDSLALDAHAELPFTLGSWQATTILGADYQKTNSTLYAASGRITGSFDLDDWDVSSIADPSVTYGTPTRTDTISKGVYAQMRVKPVSALTLIGGARFSWYDSTVTTAGVPARSQVSSHLTPFAGATWDISPDTTLYASYSEIFAPQSVTDAAGKLLDPLEGKQYEIGVKSELASGINLSAALYRLEQVNRPIAVTGETYSVAGEKVRVQGVELEAAGEIGRNLHLSGGYTYSDTEYLSGPSEGEDYSTYTPDHLFKIALEYDVTEGALEGWSFGTRLRAMSSFSSRGIKAPGYGVVDVSAARQLPGDAELRLTVANLFDKAYYSRVGSTTVFNFRGEPRTVSLALTKRF
ncbi:TonB-dependent siderophore receptor [Paenirhodobacter hankyongi]|uniref:TonB-dependent siderophore receptor n=1 Tax=Paenirhodobacter hankyongi TaxID=2294033 RepID=A0A421BLG0_9RHOB|nr:TonB-dependent siderophore receptor [Sinirhodobacter hankyongi]RLL63883.1 TonB-dependent siderophore receptor [Sinirhodobacter hankyongi]